MARKRPRLERVLGGRDLFSIAYGEIASSIYFALGIVAARALGMTPFVLLFSGALFLLVASSYAEATASAPETGGAATFVRRAFNDLAGFVVGWVLLLDYLIIIALTTLFVPHYLGAAFHSATLRRAPFDAVVAIVLVIGLVALRMVFRPSLYRFGILLAALDLTTQVLLIGLGSWLLLSRHGLALRVQLGVTPTWSALAFALPLAMLAYTGIETVANLSEESRRPAELPRSLFRAIAAVVAVYVLIAVIGLAAFPVEHGATGLGAQWRRAPLMGIVAALTPHLPSVLAVALRIFVGLSGVAILLLAATTAISGFARLAHSLGEHRMLPASFGRLHHRTLVSPQSLLAIALIAGGLLAATAPLHTHGLQGQGTFLASLFSFGILIAFSAAQLAVIRLRYSEPERFRPYRVPFSIHVFGGDLPLPAVLGTLLTIFVFGLSMATHPAARYGGPIWLSCGLIIFWLVRRRYNAGLLAQVVASDEQQLPEVGFASILVPMKLGDIGEEMMATAVRIAQDRQAAVIALNVIEVPLSHSLDEPLPAEEARAMESLEEAQTLAEENGVPVRSYTVHARSIGAAVVEQAQELGVDLIVLGSGPRWRRQSRFFSPMVEYVLRRAPCEVMIVSFPEGALEGEVVTEPPETSPGGSLSAV
ncbi:MAG: universal stress protein [Gaiellaceae bacterium]|jgi:APA family basic amino acid/polyamine antiporter